MRVEVTSCVLDLSLKCLLWTGWSGKGFILNANHTLLDAVWEPCNMERASTWITIITQSHVKNLILKIERLLEVREKHFILVVHHIGCCILKLLPPVYSLIPATAFFSWWLFSQQWEEIASYLLSAWQWCDSNSFAQKDSMIHPKSWNGVSWSEGASERCHLLSLCGSCAEVGFICDHTAKAMFSELFLRIEGWLLQLFSE